MQPGRVYSADVWADISLEHGNKGLSLARPIPNIILVILVDSMAPKASWVLYITYLLYLSSLFATSCGFIENTHTNLSWKMVAPSFFPWPYFKNINCILDTVMGHIS